MVGMKRNPPIPAGLHAIICLQCGRRYRRFSRYLFHAAPAHRITHADLVESATVTGSPGEGRFWRLPDKWALVAQPMTSHGEPVDEADEDRFVEQFPNGLQMRSSAVNNTPAACDVCFSTPIVAIYPARRFLGPTGGMMGGPTALCQACHTLWERNDTERITRRVERRLPGLRAQHRPAIRAMVETLFGNFTGLAVIIGT